MAVAVAPGDARLQFQLARALHKAGSEGNRPDAEEARALYRAAAEAGHIGAMNNLGMMLSGGVGGDRNDVEAMAWLRKAAAAGDAIAMNNLGGMLDSGRRPMRATPLKAEDDGTKVIKWIIRRAPLRVGDLPTGDVEALVWYRKAAEAGDSGAMLHLGDMLMAGRGAARDEIEGSAWRSRGLSKTAAEFTKTPIVQKPSPPPPPSP